ncbi:MAG: hypothetical protein KF887_16225 [Paracoccaceae bacterium]|nr:MAG: hypothetical protein KF887_16225 [Paracoccaceae bacterium]
MDEIDPARERLIEKARAEMALLALIGALAVATFLIMFFTETRMDPKAAALGVVCGVFGLPIVALKGPLATRQWPGAAVTLGLVAAVAWIATAGNLWVAALAAATGLAGALAFYRIRNNTAYRPRLRGEPR